MDFENSKNTASSTKKLSDVELKHKKLSHFNKEENGFEEQENIDEVI